MDILRGTMSPEVVSKGYQQLKTFAAGREVPARDWHDYLLQMLQLGYFEIAYNENNHLKITSTGSDVLFGRATARLVVIRREETNETKQGRKRKAPLPGKELPLGLPDTENEALFEALRKLRNVLRTKKPCPHTSSCPTKCFTCSVPHAPPPLRNSATSAASENTKRRNTEKNSLP